MAIEKAAKTAEKPISKYKIVIGAARRALELSEGAPKLVQVDSKRKPAVVALMEMRQGKISFRAKKKGKD